MNCRRCYACRRGRQQLLREPEGAGRPTRRRAARRGSSLPARKLHPSRTLAFDQLALVETLAIGCHAVDRRRARPGDEACLVIGAGPIGLATHRVRQADRGAESIVLDMNEQRLDFCRDGWASTHTVDASDDARERPARPDRRPPARRRDRRDRQQRLDVERVRPTSRRRAGSSSWASRPTRSRSSTRSSTARRGRSSARGTPCRRTSRGSST